MCRKIINKEEDRINYSTITNKLVEEWEEIVSINNIDEFISNYYKAIFDQVINKQIYSDEKNIYLTIKITIYIEYYMQNQILMSLLLKKLVIYFL